MKFPHPWVSRIGRVRTISSRPAGPLSVITEFSVGRERLAFCGSKPLPFQIGEHVVVVGRDYHDGFNACFVGRPGQRKIHRPYSAVGGFMAAIILFFVGLAILKTVTPTGVALIAIAFVATVRAVAWGDGQHMARRMMKAHSRPD